MPNKSGKTQCMTEVNVTAFSFTFTFCFPLPPILCFTWTQSCLKACLPWKPSTCAETSETFVEKSSCFRPIFDHSDHSYNDLNSLRPCVSSQIAHKSIIHLEGPDKLCWLQMVLASMFLWKVHVTVKLSMETIENKWVIMWSSCFVL